jgi:hypothetical protein
LGKKEKLKEPNRNSQLKILVFEMKTSLNRLKSRHTGKIINSKRPKEIIQIQAQR